MAIIIPRQLFLAPPPVPPSRFQRTASQSTAVRFFVSISPLFCFQQSSLPFPSVCFLVPFVPHLRSFRSAPPFPLFRSSVSFVPRSCSLRPASPFSSFRFLFSLVWFYEALPRSQLFPLLVLSPPLSGIFAPLKSDTCPSTFEKMPLNVRDNALLAPRPRPSTFKKTPFSSRLRMCLVSCQLQVRFCPMLPSLRSDFRVRSC